MSRTHCPFKQVCPLAQECQDHRWLCFWPIWLVILGAIGFTTYIFSSGGLM